MSEGKKKKKRIDVVIRNRNEHVFCSRQYTDDLCKMPVTREKGKKISKHFQPSHEHCGSEMKKNRESWGECTAWWSEN